MRKNLYISWLAVTLTTLLFNHCSTNISPVESMNSPEKIVVYQIFTRLFGNTNTTNKPWGTIEENGVGKFNDITETALKEIKELGVTHVWYTGVLHHALINDYSKLGISADDPDVVKGRAGSPYAIKDYYQVNPDLAVDPAKRMEEFEALIARTHQQGLKVVIDIVPNHIARKYEGKNNPKGVVDFGANDNTSLEYSKNNNFYYIPNTSFEVPLHPGNYRPLGGELHPLSDGKFEEFPAKWTGNGSRLPQPKHDDWYETVKINYGVSPEGVKEFPMLPEEYRTKDIKSHFQFWKDKEVPDSWIKFRDIALYWMEKGVDGFRYDMAEMVPVEFWSYLNSSIKEKNPEAFLLAEIYNPAEYRNYIQLGKMDYLYDKVELYDTLKNIMQGHGSTDHLVQIQDGLADISHHMLHFLENHDEQRIASPEFLGFAKRAMPGMVLSATISSSPTMIYFGQEVGEPGAENAGFGTASRTSIFDYIGVPHHQSWMNGGKFDGGASTPEEKELRDFYKRLLNVTLKNPALAGEYQQIHQHNRQFTEWYNDKVFSYIRWNKDQKILIVTNFDPNQTFGFDLEIPSELMFKLGLSKSSYLLKDLLYGKNQGTLSVNKDGKGKARIDISPLASFILEIK
jgi:glycosidase